MKIACSVIVLCLIGVGVAAQAPPGPTSVTVLEKKWRAEVYNPALDKDPLSANKNTQADLQARSTASADSERRVEQGGNALPPPVRPSTPDTESHKLSVTYVYELKIKNTGSKEIRTLIWEYVFFQPGTTEEAGRRRFISHVSIKPGATKQLAMRTPSSPTGTLDASKAGKKTSDQYSEQVVIRNIGYADGSSWPAVRK